MRAAAALLAVVVVALLGAPAALAAPPATEQPAPAGDALRLQVDELAPRVVTADGPATLAVTGSVTNTGDEPVTELGVRLQRGLPLTTEGAVRDALDGDAPADAVVPAFQGLPDTLAPGAQAAFRISVPLRGTSDTGLALTGTGVYELLVNVNGIPGDGDRARLAAVRMLLPVVGLPAGDGADVVRPEDATATPVALLYPLTDVPRRLPTVPGEPVLLADDELAASLAPEGRLGGLVAALLAAGSAARTATCVVVDPDLLQTASGMSEGYQVVASDGSRQPGGGAEAAARWLADLAAAVRGGCVLALPFADADVVALTRSGQGEQAVTAVEAGRALAAGLLATPVLPDTAWPADGVLDEATLAVLDGAGTRSLLLSADGVERAGADPTGVVTVAGGDSTATAVVTDPLLTRAAGGPVDGRAQRAGTGTAATPAAAGGALATQDALGALTFRATEAALDGSAPLVLAPPRSWEADGAAGQALLAGVDQLAASGILSPRDLAGVLASRPPETAPSLALSYPIAAGDREIPADVADGVADTLAAVADLRSSVVDDGAGVASDEVFDPLVQGAVRPLSAAWRGRPEDASAAAAAVDRRIEEIRGTVTVLQPPGPFSLGTSDSPLLLTVANGLPVTMRVRLELASTSGLRVAPIPEVEIPPLGRRQIRVNAEVIRSGVFTVDVAVRSVDGGLLGPASRLQVRSTAYGTISVWLTAIAGVLLVVLAGRRVVRRIRREPGGPAKRVADDLGPTVPLAPGPLATAPPAPGSRAQGPSGPRTPGTRPRTGGPTSRPRPSAPIPSGLRTGQSPPAPSRPVPVPGAGDAFPRPAAPDGAPRTGPPRPPGPRPPESR